MWRIGTLFFVALSIVSPVVTDILRSVIHRRRERREGIGGTQDIAMWGMLVGFGCMLAAGICGLGWYLTR